MAVSFKALNNDTTFLLTFTPPIAPANLTKPESFPGAFTILVDPWIAGPAKILSPKFSIQERVSESCISSLADLPDPDVILVSQDKPDHCHQESLCKLAPDTASLILATPAAARKIKSWGHFDFSCVESLPIYSPQKPSSVYRIKVPSFSPGSTSGEVTVSLLQLKRDMMGIHNAIGITYRPPCTVLSASLDAYIDLPTPPVSPKPQSPTRIVSSRSTIVPSPTNSVEKAISVLYTPHGVAYSAIEPWASDHLIQEAALPLTALMHSLNVVQMPWYMGGNMLHGTPGGVEIANRLLPRVWIGAHDEEKRKSGIAVHGVETEEFDIDNVRDMVDRVGVKVLKLISGEEHRIAPSGAAVATMIKTN